MRRGGGGGNPNKIKMGRCVHRRSCKIKSNYIRLIFSHVLIFCLGVHTTTIFKVHYDGVVLSPLSFSKGEIPDFPLPSWAAHNSSNHSSEHESLPSVTMVTATKEWTENDTVWERPLSVNTVEQIQEPAENVILLEERPKGLFDGLCSKNYPQANNASTTAVESQHQLQQCILQNIVVSQENETITNCSPYAGGKNNLFGMKWCAWWAKQDRHISAYILMNEVPPNEKGTVREFQEAIRNKPKSIVIDAGAQVGLFSAASLSAGHYTISIDARPEHVEMNKMSRSLNGKNDTSDGFIVHGAIADRCGQWATIPKNHERGNPGSTHVVGRVSDGRPQLKDGSDDFQVPVLTLDYIMDYALRNLPSDVEKKILAFKIDIEGYEPRALMGAMKLFSSELKPEMIIMELFVHRFKDCDAKQLIQSLVEIGYRVDVSARLNINFCGGDLCQGMVFGSKKLDFFFNKLSNNAEMDLIFRLTS